MGRAVLGFPDFVLNPGAVTPVFSGGGWRSELPLSNLLRAEFAYVARSIDATPGATQFWLDLGTPRDVQVIAIPRSNCSRAALVRVRACTTQSSAGPWLASTGWRSLYPVIYPTGTLPWGHPALWDGKTTEEDRGIFPMPFVKVFPSAVIARYWLVEISDPTNADGYVELPRIFLARGWQPSLNITYGATQGWEDLSQVQTSPFGADFADERGKRRTVRCSLQYIRQDEGIVQISDMQARLGTTRQLLFCFDPDDAANLPRRTFLCRMQSLSPLEYAVYGHVGASFDLLETIA
jgi:hypothetical protein